MNNIKVNDELLKELLGLAKVEEFEIGGRKYTSKNIFSVKEPTPVVLNVSTLTSLVDYIEANKDKLDLDTLIVQVEGPTQVRILSNLIGEFKQRDEYIRAEPRLPDYADMFNRAWAKDKFIPLLQSMFLPNPHQELLLKTLATVRVEGSADIKDDGITQTVSVHTGASRVDGAEIPNPLELIPYCTFPDVDQPKRLFTFRLKEDSSCLLFEADGGAWQQVAALSVKDFLNKELNEERKLNVTVIA
ncbi:hypothetical protein [Maridesulfovibrio ferrireducens]|uniref:hypothetical protein n=1 Tax=Maridesulfovibrio ferrireducens TaxID=246191 RepID=UPI001A2CD6D6|nr:hypothetical protein [Maridesulfovibrio ferrireducens]MBI9110256.1 hypothetical protein [Maridesulfovibrio ferrireducens]